MRFHRIDLVPAAACAALRRARKTLRARIAALRAVPDAEFARQFPAIVAAVEAGFRHEEALLERLGDACLHPRRADHAVILCALHRTCSRLENGEVKLGRQVADALDAVLSLPCHPVAAASTGIRITYHPIPDMPLRHARHRF
jgi:hypothetical protein